MANAVTEGCQAISEIGAAAGDRTMLDAPPPFADTLAKNKIWNMLYRPRKKPPKQPRKSSGAAAAPAI